MHVLFGNFGGDLSGCHGLDKTNEFTSLAFLKVGCFCQSVGKFWI